MTRHYEIAPRPIELGGGWNVKLYIDNEEAGGGVFPADPDRDPVAGMDWWNGLPEDERAVWSKVSGSTGRAVDAWGAYLAHEAYADALEHGRSWTDSEGEDQ